MRIKQNNNEKGRCSLNTSKNIFVNYFDYDESLKLKSYLSKRYGDDFEFIVYETTILNSFLNHLLAKTMVVVEVPKTFVEHVFFELKDSKLFKSILINPNIDDLYHYGENCSIIVRPYVNKVPINLKKHETTIEKLLVDIVCDPFLNSFYEGAEISNMVNEIVYKYVLKYNVVTTYAKRRHAFDKLMKYLDEQNIDFFN